MRFSGTSAILAVAAVFGGVLEASAASFEPLFVLSKVVGQVRVVRPDGSSDVAKEAHAYPYGTRIEVPAALTREEEKAARKAGLEPGRPQALVALAPDFRFRLSPGAVAEVLDEPAESATEGGAPVPHKVVNLVEGAVTTLLSAPVAKTGGAGDADAESNLNAVSVRTPICEAVRMSEQNQIRVIRLKSGATPSWECHFVSPAGKMELVGRQFKVNRIKRNTEVVVSGTEDFTRIATGRGEFAVVFEKGADATETCAFRARTVGKIWRQYAALGHRMAISVMVSQPAAPGAEEGELISFNYLEGQTGVGGGSGENPTFENAADGEAAATGDAAGFDDFGGFESFGDDAGNANDSAAGGTDAFAGFDEEW